MSINFGLLDLRAFQAVFDHASFNKAAELLNRSQPTLSRRSGGIARALDRSCGADLRRPQS
jgi:DNA-binding transcriptional LysR family regulator